MVEEKRCRWCFHCLTKNGNAWCKKGHWMVEERKIEVVEKGSAVLRARAAECPDFAGEEDKESVISPGENAVPDTDVSIRGEEYGALHTCMS